MRVPDREVSDGAAISDGEKQRSRFDDDRKGDGYRRIDGS